MTRNNADFKTSPHMWEGEDLIEDQPERRNSAPEVADAEKWYHVSPRMNRQSIERHGLRANDHFARYDMSDAEKKRRGRGKINEGVFVSRTPETLYGDDVYEVRGFSPKVMHATGDTYFPQSVPPSRVTRVGHVAKDKSVHWHPEEACPNN